MSKRSSNKHVPDWIGRAVQMKRRAVTAVPRMQPHSCRALAGMGLLAVVAALVLERLGEPTGFHGFCIGLLFGLGVGLTAAAIISLIRERVHG